MMTNTEITKALNAMGEVSEQLQRDERGDTGWGLWYTLFGQYAPYLSLMVSVIAVLLILCLFGPCMMRCVQHLALTTFSKHAEYRLLHQPERGLFDTELQTRRVLQAELPHMNEDFPLDPTKTDYNPPMTDTEDDEEEGAPV